MAASKKQRSIRSEYVPAGRQIRRANDPESIYAEHPSWRFYNSDREAWPIDGELAQIDFWSDVFPRMKGLETQTWGEIMVGAKKQYHSLDLDDLNKPARDRLDALRIEAESIISLRVGATKRLYGYMDRAVFCVLWYDPDHGDNNTCVCRAAKKHT